MTRRSLSALLAAALVFAPFPAWSQVGRSSIGSPASPAVSMPAGALHAGGAAPSMTAALTPLLALGHDRDPEPPFGALRASRAVQRDPSLRRPEFHALHHRLGFKLGVDVGEGMSTGARWARLLGMSFESRGARLYMVQDSGSGATDFYTAEELSDVAADVQVVGAPSKVALP